MARHNSEGNFAWFVAGISLGITGAILFAPKSGKETREQIADAATKGREFATEQKKQATQFGRELYEKGRDFVEEKGRDLVEEMKLPKGAMGDSKAEADKADSTGSGGKPV